MSLISHANDADFEKEVLNSKIPVLVDFWAPWCGPCRMIAPLLEQLATENGNTVKIVKINVDDSPNTAAGFGISSIPTIMLFKGGQVVERFVGVQPKQRLQEAIS